jgi:hypothetical protein
MYKIIFIFLCFSIFLSNVQAGVFIPAILGGETLVYGDLAIMVGGRAEFALIKYLNVGIEAKYVLFVIRGSIVGFTGEYHMVPQKLSVIDPYFMFSFGYAFFGEDHIKYSGSIVELGLAIDFRPKSKVMPFIELGIFNFKEDISFLFKGGLKLNL